MAAAPNPKFRRMKSAQVDPACLCAALLNNVRGLPVMEALGVPDYMYSRSKFESRSIKHEVMRFELTLVELDLWAAGR
eukprot:2432008-Alexandrium_andersonii.AAC.1